MTPTLRAKVKAIAVQLRADGPPMAKWARDVAAACIPTIRNSAGMATARLGYAWHHGRPTWDVRYHQGRPRTVPPEQAPMHKGERIIPDMGGPLTLCPQCGRVDCPLRLDPRAQCIGRPRR